MKFEKIEPGMVLYDVHSYTMGNTRIRSLGTWTVRVVSVDRERRLAVVSWNGNPPQTWYERNLRKLKAVRPMLVRTSWGAYRRATKDEKKRRDEVQKSI